MMKVYLDNNSSTQVREEVINAMTPYLGDIYGNPSSTHSYGRESRAAIEKSRAMIANALNVDPDELYFTSSATEGNNFTIKGLGFSNMESKGHIITTKIEHKSVLQPCRFLQRLGFDVTFLPVDKYGMVDPDDLKKAFRDETILVSVMWANNEIGTIQPIEELVKITHDLGVPFHSDGVQAIGKLETDLEKVPVDFFTLSGHKIYGPKGIGLIFIRKGTEVVPLIHGGGHERNKRAGTENLQGIVGLGEAVKLCVKDLSKDSIRLKELTDNMIHELQVNIDGVIINGHPEKRLPGTAHLGFKGIDNQALMVELDIRGIAVSAGSACTAGSVKPSHVLQAIGTDAAIVKSCVRISMGRLTTKAEIDYVVKTFIEVTKKLKQG